MTDQLDTPELNLPLSARGRPRFISIEMDEWEPLGGPVKIDLSPHRTILVGLNGSGKSTLLEGIVEGANDPFRLPAIPLGPQMFRCTAEDATAYQFNYEHRHRLEQIDNSIKEEENLPRIFWSEKCGNARTPCIWSVEDSILKFSRGSKEQRLPVPPGASYLSMLRQSLSKEDTEENKFSKLAKEYPKQVYTTGIVMAIRLINIFKVNAGLPRIDAIREEIIIPLAADGRRASASQGRVFHTGLRKVRRSAKRIVDWFQQNHSIYEEFVDIGKRIGLFNTLQVTTYGPESPQAQAHKFATVMIDGVNLGFVADGTLRAIEILQILVSAPRASTILIEEPETGIHPGLLQKVLTEIDAYTRDKQVLISTHSPQVVSWAHPDELRLVERKEGHTKVRALTAAQADHVAAFLNDMGTLGDYVYGGALEDE